VIRIERSGEGRARVIGGLETAVLQAFLDGADGEELTLDLSEVYAAEGSAVRLLAHLPLERCRLVGCPQWLSVWIEGERRRSFESAAVSTAVQQG
jgi:hypothetical protein